MADRDFFYELEFQVRDYECDLQGIVNNAVYQHYLEHTRHEFLKAAGSSFSDLLDQGIDPVVSRIEIDYLAPLVSDDKFVVQLNFRQRGRFRLVFNQYLRKLPEFDPIADAVVTVAFIDRTGGISRPVPVPRDVVAAAEAYRNR